MPDDLKLARAPDMAEIIGLRELSKRGVDEARLESVR